MVIISMFMGILFLIMLMFGVFLLVLSLILSLVNRHRRKKGMPPGRVMNVVKILCLVFGCLNIAPFVFICLFSFLAEPASTAYGNIRQAFMPKEMAVLWRYQADQADTDVTDTEMEDEEDILEYKGQEYLPLRLMVEEDSLTCSEPKASLQYGKKKAGQAEVELELKYDGMLVCEVESRTDVTLLCTGKYENFIFDRTVVPYEWYCLKSQYYEFMLGVYDEAQYVLEWTSKSDSLDVTDSDFSPARLGMTSEHLLALKEELGQDLEHSWNGTYDLKMTSKDGMFKDAVCANIKKEKDVWYCSYLYNTDNAYPLPEEGQHFMNELNVSIEERNDENDKD